MNSFENNDCNDDKADHVIYLGRNSQLTGAGDPGGSGGVGPPLEFEIYLVNFLKNRKKRGFFSIGPPLGKNRSSAPAYNGCQMGHILKIVTYCHGRFTIVSQHCHCCKTVIFWNV